MTQINPNVFQSKATNLLEFMRELIPIFQEEPRRVYMSSFIAALHRVPLSIRPACGTVCCIGGWMAARSQPVVQGRLLEGKIEEASRYESAAERWAFELLMAAGISYHEIHNLFYYFPDQELDPGSIALDHYGSQAYVNLVVEHLQEFINAHYVQLESMSLDGAIAHATKIFSKDYD